MDKTRIEWADATWNPVTGCLHGCEYCYAARIAARFNGGFGVDGIHESPVPFRKVIKRDKPTGQVELGRAEPYPYGFAPTFHRYRLDIPKRWTKPRTIFVCSMADLFGRWVPFKWIKDVFDACLKAPRHRYLFLTKNTDRYMELDYMAMLPHLENFWYGASVTSNAAAIPYPGNLLREAFLDGRINTFWSMEPLLGPVDMNEAKGVPGWVIVGAETGNRSGKIIPEKEWIDRIVKDCDLRGVPVFMKDSLIPVVGEENMRREFPW